MQTNPSSKPIEIKISTVVAVSVILRQSDLAVLNAALAEMTGSILDYFDNEFAVIDVGLLEVGENIDWAGLVDLLRQYHLNAVAVRNASPEMEPSILALGLSLDTMVKLQQVANDEPVAAAQPEPVPVVAPEVIEAPAAPERYSMMVDTPVRAGQRIYSRGDLIVTAAVNNGAEVIADGSIHIYAPLRGRALAGASGNVDARIFAMVMEAELVSIAGLYRTFENGFPEDLAQQPAQVRLVGDRIDVIPVNLAARS